MCTIRTDNSTNLYEDPKTCQTRAVDEVVKKEIRKIQFVSRAVLQHFVVLHADTNYFGPIISNDMTHEYFTDNDYMSHFEGCFLGAKGESYCVFQIPYLNEYGSI